ncbi:ribonuclease Z, mitochondrial isoform X2 [Prorops nasuta]|uniref:ribonuclease Z, mitochondrial isoform X2 n=1 Tax=Prorops nasuta TaxID=863751 RepID=UPI0034CFC76E
MSINTFFYNQKLIYSPIFRKLLLSNVRTLYFQRNYKKKVNSNIVENIVRKMSKKNGKYKSNEPVNSAQLIVAGSGSYGTASSMFLVTDHKKYLFNCGEGTQRICNEHKIKIIKMEHIFLTSNRWSNFGGIPGMLLTSQGMGIENLTVHGPKGNVQLIEATKKFAPLTISVSEAPCNTNEPFKDSTMTVWYVPIKKASRHETNILKQTTNDNYDINQNGKRILNESDSFNKKEKTEFDDTQPEEVDAMSYICKMQDKPTGKLLLEKCLEKGLTPGPLLKKIKDGEDVTLPNGTIVRSKDVCEPAVVGPTFLVVECPTFDHLVHFTPSDIMSNQIYKDWMNKFPKETHHLIINEKNTCRSSEAIYRYQHGLHLIHPDIFPILDTKFMENSDNEQLEINRDETLVHYAKSNLTVGLIPKQYIDSSHCIKLQPKEYIQNALDVENFLDVLAEHQTNVAALTKTLPQTPLYPKVTFLGTGSSIPSKTRNTSAILLNTEPDHSILLDCGEGTMNQIIKLYGESGAKKVLASIKAIYVSHLHADHHLGIFGVLEERRKVTNESLYAIIPNQLFPWFNFYDTNFNKFLDNVKLINNKDILMDSPDMRNSKIQGLYDALKITSIDTTPVYHCQFAYGVSLELISGLKIVYSGDTRPSTNLVKLGQNCDILIHEATMEDELHEEAKKKSHSTVSEAIKIGNDMNAKFILLTHFSQRYCKVPRITDGLDLTNIGIAFDNMQVHYSELPLLPLFYTPMKVLFNEHFNDLEDRAFKRQKKLL